MKQYMTSLSQVMNELRQRGYTEDFNLCQDCIDSPTHACQIYPEDFVIDRVYRFEGESDPADQAILYAISVPSRNIKGLLVNGYGLSANPLTQKMVEKLSVH